MLFPVSVKERMKPIKPVNISVIINPTRVNTNIYTASTPNIVENNAIETASRIPKPANVIGMKPAAFATGNSNRK